MNCKQGDIAIVVKSFAGHEGKIVRCIRLAEETEWIDLEKEPTCLIRKIAKRKNVIIGIASWGQGKGILLVGRKLFVNEKAFQEMLENIQLTKGCSWKN